MENAFFRYKSIIGDGLRARSPDGQGSEVVLGCEILNRMTALGRLVSVSHRQVRILAVGIVRARDDGIVKLRLMAVLEAQHGGFATGWSPVSWGSINELFVNLTMPSREVRPPPTQGLHATTPHIATSNEGPVVGGPVCNAVLRPIHRPSTLLPYAGVRPLVSLCAYG